MKKLNSLRMGVAQGEIVIFSEFQDGGDMWTGQGMRQRSKYVPFEEAFIRPPAVHTSLVMWDVHHAANMRMDLSSDNVSEKGFEVIFRTWGDTRVGRVRVSWMAIGEFHDDDLWDV